MVKVKKEENNSSDVVENSKMSDSDTIEIPIGRWFGFFKNNAWRTLSIVLGIILIVLIIVMITGKSVNGGVTAETAGKNLVDFINAQGNGQASVVSVEKSGSLYSILVDYSGQQIPVYVTLDGKYLVTQPVALDGSAVQNTDTTADNTANTPSAPVDIPLGNSPSTGSKSAKVTVVEFSDFSCPYCAAASGDNQALIDYMKQNNPSWEPIVTNMLKDYVNTGKVRFVVKYTLGHSGGKPAQNVAWCLNEQNLYWKFYPKAFATYDLNIQNQDVEDLDKMKELAKSVGANMVKLNECLDSKKYDSQFNTETAEGRTAGVSGTPAFFVNGKLVSGAVPYSQIKALIEQELNA